MSLALKRRSKIPLAAVINCKCLWFCIFIVSVGRIEARWFSDSGDRIKQEGISGSVGAVSSVFLCQA